jgi:hypothetical protein
MFKNTNIEFKMEQYHQVSGAGIAQLVQRLATGWTTEESEFESPLGQKFTFLYIVQTGSGAHPTSYPMGTGGFFSGSKAARGVKLTTHLQLVPRSR